MEKKNKKKENYCISNLKVDSEIKTSSKSRTYGYNQLGGRSTKKSQYLDIRLYCETNDITNDMKTTKEIKKLVKKIPEIDIKVSTSSSISGIIKRKNYSITK